MKAFLTKFCSGKLLPLSWTFFTIISLCLPGSAIPGAGIFAGKGLDKIVHFILFGGIVLVWGLYVQKAYPYTKRFKMILLAAVFSISLGVVLEYVQRYFIPNRTFDINDITADAAGAATVLLLVGTRRGVFKNKKPL